MTTATQTYIEDNKIIISSLIIGTAAFFTFLVLPLYVGMMAEVRGFDEGQLGLLASVDLIGLALMSLTGSLWIHRVNWRKTVRLAILWIIICNFAAIFIADFGMLCLVRFLAGISAGLLAVMLINIISYTRDPDRVMAIYVVLQIILQVCGFLALPSLLETWSITGYFCFANAVLVFALLFSGRFPEETENKEKAVDSTLPTQSSIPPFLVLIGMAAFFIAQVAIFSFVERMATDQGISAQEIGNALTGAVIIGLAGAVLGAVMSTRFGRFWPILLAGTIEAYCFYLLLEPLTATSLLIITGAIQFCWNLALGYQVGALINTDRNHRFIMLLPFFQMLGVALAPAIGGFAITSGGYSTMISVSIGALVVYMVLLLPFSFNKDEA